MPEPAKNVICPDSECGAENPPDAKRCQKCNYPIAAQPEFERMVRVTAKKKRAETPPQDDAEDSFLDGLLK